MTEMVRTGDERHFGAFLREARERQKISAAEVAESIKISQSCLAALERAAWDELPPEIFVRGFVKTYARILGVNEGEPLNLLDREVSARRRSDDELQVPVVSGATHELLPVDAPPVDPDIARRPVGLALFVVIVLVISIVALSYLLHQPAPPGEGLSWGPSQPCEVAGGQGAPRPVLDPRA